MTQSEENIVIGSPSLEKTVTITEDVSKDSTSNQALPQLDATHYVSQLFWLFITFSILYFVLSRNVIPKVRSVLQDRQNRIQADLEQAQILRDKAEASKVEYESSLEHAQKKAAELISEANATIDAEIKKRHEELDRTLDEQMAQAESKVAKLVDDTKGQLVTVRDELVEAIIQKVLYNKVDGVVLPASPSSQETGYDAA